MSEEADQTTKLPRNVRALGGVSFCNDAASEMIVPLLPLFLATTLGAGPAAIGIIEGVAQTTASVLKYVSGRLSDRLRVRKPLFVAGYILSNIVRPLIALATSWPQVLALRFGDRIGKGVRNSPRDALLADSVDPSQHGRAFGWQRGADHAGAALGPAIAAILLGAGLDLRTVFLLSVIPGICTVAIAALVVHEVPPQPKPAAEPGAPKLPADPRMRRFLLAVTVFALGNSTDAFLLLRAHEAGIAVMWAPVLWMVLHLVKTGTSVPGGRLSDRLSPRTALMLGWGVYALVYLGFGLASEAWMIWALFAIYGLHFGLSEAAERTLVARLTPGHGRGRGYGAYHLATGIAALPASIGFGALWQWGGAAAAFGAGAALAVVAALLMLRVNPAGQRSGVA